MLNSPTHNFDDFSSLNASPWLALYFEPQFQLLEKSKQQQGLAQDQVKKPYQTTLFASKVYSN